MRATLAEDSTQGTPQDSETVSIPPLPPIPSAPWGDDLDAAARAELRLQPLREVAAQTVDVVVIGAGVAGLSAALAAARAGARVLALEAAPAIGRGATGQNAGILSAGINMALADLPPGSPEREMWPATTRALLDYAGEAVRPGSLLTASLTGALSLAETRGAARHLEQEVRVRSELGLRAELWTACQAAEKTDGRLNTQSVVAALWLPDEGRIQPLTLLAHLARQARTAGATLAAEAEVAAYEEMAGCGSSRYWQVRTTEGITLAARGLIVATGPIRAATKRIYALAFRADLPDDFPLFWDSAPYTYCDFRPGNGRLTVSGGRYGRAGGSPRAANYYRRLADEARRWLPELAGSAPSHAWAVDLAVATDLVPRIRDLDAGAPGAAIEGLGALGVLPGTVLGRRAGEALARRLGGKQLSTSDIWQARW